MVAAKDRKAALATFRGLVSPIPANQPQSGLGDDRSCKRGTKVRLDTDDILRSGASGEFRPGFVEC